jgi:MFS family permease
MAHPRLQTTMERPVATRAWIVLALLTGFWGLVGLNRLGIAYLFPVIVPEFHMADWQAGLLISGTSLTWAISSWGSGWLSDRYGRRKVMLPGAAVACVSTAAMGGAWNFLSLLVVREAIGIGDGVGWPNAQAVLAAEFPAKRRALVQSIFTSGYPLFGSVLGAIIVTELATTLGWRWVFPIIGAVFLLVVIGLYFFMHEPERRPEPTAASTGTAEHAAKQPAPAKGKLDWRSAVAILNNRTIVVLMIIQAGALGWLQAGVAYNSLFLNQDRHLSLVTTGKVLSIMGVASLAGTLLLPSLSDWIGRKPAMLLGGVLSGVCMALYAVGDFGLTTWTLLLAGSGFFSGVLIPLAAATCVVENVRAEVQATAMGAINFAGVIVGTFLLPIVGGILSDSFGRDSALLLAAGSVTIAGLAVFAIPETAPRVLARRARPAIAATAAD